jgi:hypothetical protein
MLLRSLPIHTIFYAEQCKNRRFHFFLFIQRSQHRAFLLNCSNRCSFAHPASYFIHSMTLFSLLSLFCESSLLRYHSLPSQRGMLHTAFYSRRRWICSDYAFAIRRYC